MKVAYATIVYKNRRQKYYLFLYETQISVNFFTRLVQNGKADKAGIKKEAGRLSL